MNNRLINSQKHALKRGFDTPEIVDQTNSVSYASQKNTPICGFVAATFLATTRALFAADKNDKYQWILETLSYLQI